MSFGQRAKFIHVARWFDQVGVAHLSGDTPHACMYTAIGSTLPWSSSIFFSSAGLPQESHSTLMTITKIFSIISP